MKYKQLGRSGLVVADLALGTMVFGEGDPRGASPDQSARMIARYIDAGGNHIDTADVYAGGLSEKIVGKALKGKRDSVVLATKVRFPRGSRPNDEGLSRLHIIEGVNASLARLDTDHIDLYYVHCWDPLTPLEESLRAFEDLVTSGKVRYIGVSNFKAWQVMKALATSDRHGWARFVAAQYQYSLVKRDIEYEFADLLQEEGLGLVPWSPLGGGFLSGKYKRGRRPQSPDEGRIATQPEEDEEAWQRRDTERNWQALGVVGEIADARHATYSQIALAWLRAQPGVSSVIMGVRTMEQLDDNLGAAGIELSPAEMERLDRSSDLPELYPYHFIAQNGRAVPR